jgi:hypothetical protein
MKPYYLTLSETKLREVLSKRGMTDEGVERIVAHVVEAKRKVRSERAYRKKHVQEWRALLTPLRQEWNNANVGEQYAPDDTLRVVAFQTYAEVLYALYERLSALAFNDVSPTTPAIFADELNKRNEKSGKSFRVPNNGTHWVDWVKPSERARVDHAFAEWSAAGTRKKHAKTKEPFKRVDGDKVFAKNKARLIKAVTSERDTLTLKYEIAMQGLRIHEADHAARGSERKAKNSDVHLRVERRLSKARRALSILTRWEQADGALPRTWHGVLKKE